MSGIRRMERVVFRHSFIAPKGDCGSFWKFLIVVDFIFLLKVFFNKIFLNNYVWIFNQGEVLYDGVAKACLY